MMQDYMTVQQGAVAQWECDHMGHWNVQFYITGLSAGLRHLHFLMVGKLQESPWDILEILVRYQREMHAGDVYRVEAGIMDVQRDRLELDVNIINLNTDQVAANMEIVLAPTNVATGSFTHWSQELFESLRAHITERKFDHRPSSTLHIPEPFDGGYQDPFISCRTAVNTWECDEWGRMAPQFLFDRATHSVGHMRHRLGYFAARDDGLRLGSAALEYRMVILKTLEAGTVMTIRSGINDFRGKTFRFGHTFYDDVSGEACVICDVVGIFFDLDTRKSIAPPPEIAARFDQNRIVFRPAHHPLLAHA